MNISFSFQAYPSSYNQAQRGYLLCQLSAVSCKRSLFDTYETEDLSEKNIDHAFQMCIILEKPIHYCVDQILQKRTRSIHEIN